MTPAAKVPTLAYVPEPMEDEPLDVWIRRVADTLCIAPSGLQATLGLPRNRSFSVVRDLSDDDLRGLAEATGLDVATLHGMTLARWEEIGLRPSATQRGHGGGAWARSRGERHCPDCLAERAGIPRLQWYLHWSFACVRHHRLLTTGPGHMLDASPQENGRTTQLGTFNIDPTHPAITTQRALDAVFDHPSRPVDSLGASRGAWVYLRDMAALTRMAVISGLTPQSRLAQHVPAPDCAWAKIHEEAGLSLMTSPAKRLHLATQHPGLMAWAATLAQRTLASSSPEAAAGTLWWLPAEARGSAISQARSRELSWPLVRALDESTPRRRSGGLLVHRFGLARFDDAGSRRSPLDAAKVPASCWVSASQCSPVDSLAEIGAVAASTALLAIGAHGGIISALDRIGQSHLARRVRADWHRTFDFGDDPYFETLLRLHGALVEGEVPINYARRRRSFPTPSRIGNRAARQAARELNVPLTDRLVRHMSWYVHELLSGSNVLLSPSFLDLWATHRIAYRKQRAIWNAAQPPALSRVAERELLRMRIDEPVTWQPVHEVVRDSWTLPSPAPHLLPGWSQGARVMRGDARPRREDLAGYALDEAVALAALGNTGTARQIARRLTRFAALAAAGSLRDGARCLGMSGAALSFQMTALERDLACRLFDRSGNTTKLTAEGRQLLHLIERNRRELLQAVERCSSGYPRLGGPCA